MEKKYMRIIAIWVLGLVGCFFLGSILGLLCSTLYPEPRPLMPMTVIWGSVGAMCLFASLRLWFAK
ncbi:hypothetical protein [Bradyrhizobium sp. HKCCYLS20291]|uniref:hypothetical protein n=1 Tax=Bradyrhizobium sp. HKCCYLS20291 TaxID=3420766 RepID=UPI003EBAB545